MTETWRVFRLKRRESRPGVVLTGPDGEGMDWCAVAVVRDTVPGSISRCGAAGFDGVPPRRPKKIDPGTLSRPFHPTAAPGARASNARVRWREWIPPAKPALATRSPTRRSLDPMRGDEPRAQARLKPPEPRPDPNTRAKRGVPTESAQRKDRSALARRPPAYADSRFRFFALPFPVLAGGALAASEAASFAPASALLFVDAGIGTTVVSLRTISGVMM